MLWRQATALKALRTNLTVIMPVLGLTNLVVSDAGPDFTLLSQRLPLFKSLQTLFLGCNPETLITRNKPLSFPNLHLDRLEALRELRSVDLDRLMPGSIRLDEDRKLYITVTGTLRSMRVLQLVITFYYYTEPTHKPLLGSFQVEAQV